MSSFSSSSFDAVIIATATDAAPEDNAEAPAKDGFEDEAADGIAKVRRALQRPRHGGRRRWLLIIANLHQEHSTNFYHGNRQIKIKLIISI